MNKQILDELNLVSLHFQDEHGTNLTVGLRENSKWQLLNGTYHCDPYFDKTDGTVVISEPLTYYNQTISGISLTYKDGIIVKYDATENLSLLTRILLENEGFTNSIMSVGFASEPTKRCFTQIGAEDYPAEFYTAGLKVTGVDDKGEQVEVSALFWG